VIGVGESTSASAVCQLLALGRLFPSLIGRSLSTSSELVDGA